MKRKTLLLILSIALSITLTSCTKGNKLVNIPTSPSVNESLTGTNDPNGSSTTESKPSTDNAQAEEPLKEEVKPQPIEEQPNNYVQPKPPEEPTAKEVKSVPPAVELPKEPTVFKQGDKGEKVKEIQQKLNKFGHKLIVDGYFGSLTYSAVIDFQTRNKITSDGIVGASTLAKLNLTPTAETMYKPPAPQYSTNNTSYIEELINSRSFASKTNYFIWIDIPKQRVNIFTGSNNNWKLLKSMVCATGKSHTPTIKGNFTVGVKGSYFIADGGARCKWYTQIKGNYLFHSVLYDNNGDKIIDGTLGVPASHGCVRLATENAKFIYDNIPSGTAIWSN